MIRRRLGEAETSGRVAGIVLAAGASSRMGGDFKLLLPFGGSTVLESAVGTALDAGLDPVVVVVGHRADDVRRALAGSRARPVFNPAHAAGQASSLGAGIQAVAGEADVSAAVILLGDEPGLRREAVAAVVDGWRETAAPAVRARYSDRPGHPVLFDRSLFPALRELEGDEGAASLLRGLGDRLRHVRAPWPAPVDVDTPAAYEAALRRCR